jgi:hypothetical protein
LPCSIDANLSCASPGLYRLRKNSVPGKTFPQRLKPFLLLIAYVRAEARTLQKRAVGQTQTLVGLCQPRTSVRGSGFSTRENAAVPNFRALALVAGPSVHKRPYRKRTGAPGSPKRTWAEKDGRSPTTAFCDIDQQIQDGARSCHQQINSVKDTNSRKQTQPTQSQPPPAHPAHSDTARPPRRVKSR